jgi:hypothetical protein
MRQDKTERYWEQRLLARSWLNDLMNDPVQTLSSENIVWRLEDIVEIMRKKTGADVIGVQMLGRMLTAAGFNKVKHPVRTCDGQTRLWIMRRGRQMSGADAVDLYDRERRLT